MYAFSCVSVHRDLYYIHILHTFFPQKSKQKIFKNYDLLQVVLPTLKKQHECRVENKKNVGK